MTHNALANLPPLRDPVARPKWAAFLGARGYGIDDPDVQKVVGRSREYIRRIGLPWDHAKRITPTDAEQAVIRFWTRGEISEGDWEPPTDGGEAETAPSLEAVA